MTHECGVCHRRVTISWTDDPGKGAPETKGGILKRALVAWIGKPPAEPAALPLVRCPECEATCAASEIVGLRGGVFLACPHCGHEMAKRIASVGHVVCCDVCECGFTAGAAKGTIGTLVNAKATRNDHSSGLQSANKDLVYEVPIHCKQRTYIKRQKGATTEITEKEISLTPVKPLKLFRPVTGETVTSVVCEYCGAAYKVLFRSVEAARRRSIVVAAIGLAGLPVLAISYVGLQVGISETVASIGIILGLLWSFAGLICLMNVLTTWLGGEAWTYISLSDGTSDTKFIQPDGGGAKGDRHFTISHGITALSEN